MIKKILYTLLIFFTGFFNANAQVYPAIHNNRPRLYADSARFAWLQNNIPLGGDCQTTYNEFDYRYNNWWINDPQLYLTGSDSTLWTWNWGSVYAKDEAVFTILMYKLNQDALSLKRCRFLTQKVIDTLSNANYSAMSFFEEEDFIRLFSDVGSLLIDWCYNALPDTLLQQLVRVHYGMNREFMNTFILSAAGNSYVSSHNAWNSVYANQNALALFNATGLDSLENDTVNQWYQVVYDKWENNFLPVYGYYRDDDGGWNWGAAYSMWSLIDQFQYFDNMLTGTGKNYYTDLPWVQNSINQYWYFMQPNDWCIHLGDGQTFLAGDRVTYRHATLFNDPRSIWLAQKYAAPQYYYSTPFVFQKLLFKDFTIPTITQPALPLDWWSDKVGLSVSRSSWDSTASMVTFFNSPSKRAAHEHRDNNSFTIFKNTPLLLDAGYYDTYAGTHYKNYYSRTIAHNTICVFDSADNYVAFGNPASNDGGQIESSALQNYADIFLPQNQRGQWIKYGADNNYQINIADAQLSYDTAKIDFFRRRLLFIKPNRVIVLDHIHLKNSTTQQRKPKWIAHFEKQPQVSGNIINTSVAGHVETFNGNDYTVVNGQGNLAIRTLLPANTTTTVIGGTNYEYYVDGINYPPLVQPDTNKFAPGKWRIEVEPTLISDSLIYLHTINIGDSLNIALAGGIAEQNIYSVGADWNDTLFYFSSDADTGKVYHVFYDIAGGRTVAIFAADMQTGNYFVIVDGIPFATATADINGVLQSSVQLSAGNHTIEIVQQITAVFSVAGTSESISVFPNPVKTELNIANNIYKKTELQITNSLGEIVLKASNTNKINVVELSSGIYFLQIKQGVSYFVTKFVKE